MKNNKQTQHHLPDTDKNGNSLLDLQQETDDYLEQALHEYITWLAQTELKHAQLALTHNREKNRYRVWQQQYKEALDDLWKHT